MIFPILMIPIILFFSWMYWHDVSQDKTINEFFKVNNCLEINNYKSKYIGLCKKDILIINDYFTVDLNTNIKINYNDITKVSHKEKEIIINHQNKNSILYFENEKKKSSYLNLLNKKVKL